ncbi:TlpA disulfide reductase family protein [Afipia birgiae]|jgi:thiol-disulfide isomerase/thioredoxin|uniref:TlpA disulfide reductase family protein n=1 Tax=Afipia birgiae TaxID=151414 RepID=UPI000311745A|nr:TlpA disulfide reductase family protein [Afipia birgiae]MBX9821745.1 TlpA family protein disulfide reductase [Afipia birgiae]
MTASDEAADPARHAIARRTVLGGMLGAASSVMMPSSRAQARTNGPPPFGTARSQFTLLAPVKTVPSLPLTRLNGATDNFAAFRGKTVLVNFWATWCAACRVELPILDRLQETTGQKNLKVVAISLDRNGRAAVLPFVQKLKIRHLEVYLDPDGRVGSVGNDNATAPFPIYGMPISYVVGPSGRIEGYLTGEADWLSDDARNLLSYYASPMAG